VAGVEQDVGAQSLDSHGLAGGRAQGCQRCGGDDVHGSGVEVPDGRLALKRPSRRRNRGDDRVEFGTAGPRGPAVGERDHRLVAVQMAAVTHQPRQRAKSSSRLAGRDAALGVGERPDPVARDSALVDGHRRDALTPE